MDPMTASQALDGADAALSRDDYSKASAYALMAIAVTLAEWLPELAEPEFEGLADAIAQEVQ